VPGDIDVAVDIDHTARGGDVAQLGDVMFGVAEHHGLEASLRRFGAHERIETLLGEHLVDGAQTVGALGMSGRRDMVEACRMGEKKGGHGALEARDRPTI
jgi:hypothetical protein